VDNFVDQLIISIGSGEDEESDTSESENSDFDDVLFGIVPFN
jgi:hypothetical protein